MRPCSNSFGIWLVFHIKVFNLLEDPPKLETLLNAINLARISYGDHKLHKDMICILENVIFQGKFLLVYQENSDLPNKRRQKNPFVHF